MQCKHHHHRVAAIIKSTTLAFMLVSIPLHAYRASAEEKKTERPNIIFLLADDLGWTGLTCFGSDLYETPHLDQLAKSGLKLTSAYSACTVCSPTRASIMTGIYPARLRLTDFISGQNRPFAKLQIPDWNPGLDHSLFTIAEALREQGYRTAQVGKWHLLHPSNNIERDGPGAHGFDLAIDKPKGTRGYRLPKGSNRNGESGSDYLTDYLTDRALQFIDQAHEDPFFLYFAYHVPHTPIDGRDDLVAEYRKKVRDNSKHKNPEYAAMVNSMDSSAGRLLKRLEHHGIADKTLVIFTSDNGGLTQRYGKHDGFTDNFPLRRGKGSAYEGGVRVPAIVRWPGVTKPGTESSEPVSTIDYFPTLLDAANCTENKVGSQPVDGKSLVDLFRNPSKSLQRDLFWHYPHYHAGGDSPYGAIRSGKWRLIEFYENGGIELYDLHHDPGETDNLVSKHPNVTRKLLGKLHSWRKSVDAQMTTPNPDHDPTKALQVTKKRK